MAVETSPFYSGIAFKTITRYKHRIATKNQWVFTFIDADFNDKYLPFLCQSVNNPTISFSTELSSDSRFKYFKSVEPPADITVTFFETENRDLEKYFNNWVASFYDKKNRCFIKNLKNPSPKREAVLTLLKSVAGARVVAEKYFLRGLMPKKFEDLSYEQTDGGGQIVTLTFSVDRIDPNSELLNKIQLGQGIF